GAARSISDRGGEDRPPRHRRSIAPPLDRALHRRQRKLQRADLAVADRSPGRRFPAGLAGRDRRTTLLPGGWRIRLSGSAGKNLRRADPRPERGKRDRGPRGWGGGGGVGGG